MAPFKSLGTDYEPPSKQVGIGIACRDRCVAFASTFACFFTRAFDNFRMGVISQTNLNVVGSHCGVSIGEDGPSQMGLEDLVSGSSDLPLRADKSEVSGINLYSFFEVAQVGALDLFYFGLFSLTIEAP